MPALKTLELWMHFKLHIDMRYINHKSTYRYLILRWPINQSTRRWKKNLQCRVYLLLCWVTSYHLYEQAEKAMDKTFKMSSLEKFWLYHNARGKKDLNCKSQLMQQIRNCVYTQNIINVSWVRYWFLPLVGNLSCLLHMYANEIKS